MAPEAEAYRRYLEVHASALRTLLWLLEANGTIEERAEYARWHKLYTASTNVIERARLNERMDAILHSIRARIEITEAGDSGAAGKAEILASSSAIWRRRRDAAQRVLERLGPDCAAFRLSERGDTLTLTLWSERSHELRDGARSFAKGWHADLRIGQLGRARVIVRYAATLHAGRTGILLSPSETE